MKISFILCLVQACYVLLGGSLHVQYPLDQNFRIKFLLGKIFCLGLQSITKKPVHEHEHLAEFEVWFLILLSHHEVLGITYLPLLTYEINPFNLSFVRLSKLISGIGLSNLVWFLAPHDDSVELPSNFKLQFSFV